MEEANSNNCLLECMGFHGENQDPSTATANWNYVERRLWTHPQEARTLWGISYPLNLALSNSITPAPANAIKSMIECYPEACNEEDFGNACRYKHTTGDVLRVLLLAKPVLPGKDFVKRWDLDWIACNSNKDAARVLINNCEAAQPSCIKEWKEMRPSSHTFWFTLLLENASTVVSLQNIISKRLLMFFILQGNYANVKLMLDTYPELISVRSFRGESTKQLPIHTALANSESAGFRPWHNRSPIVRLLLERGLEYNVGGEDGCGGLFTLDSSTSALNQAVSSALNCPWNDPERNKCLQICLQFAQASMYNVSPDKFDLPLLHNCIGVLQISAVHEIFQKHAEFALQKAEDGRTAIFHLIATITERPANGYMATREIMRNKRQERDREDGNDRRNVAIPRGGNDDNEGNRFFINLMPHQGRHVLERMAGRLWDRERAILFDEPELNHQGLVFVESRPRALRRLIDLIERRRGNRNGGDNVNDHAAPEPPANDYAAPEPPAQGNVHANELSQAQVELARRFRRFEMRRQRLGNDLNYRIRARVRPQMIDLQDDIDLEPDMNIGLENFTPLRNLIEDRNRELDDVQERLVEKQYFDNILKMLLGYIVPSARGKFVNCAKIKDNRGMLPLHFAAERGMTLEQGFKDILNAYPEAISKDADGFFPFMYAASANASLNMVYQLLRECPETIYRN